MAIPPTAIRILFTNYDIIAYFLNLASCPEHFMSIKHRILATFNINNNKNADSLYAFKRNGNCIIIEKYCYNGIFFKLIILFLKINRFCHIMNFKANI